jgi:hypothetical protein
VRESAAFVTKAGTAVAFAALFCAPALLTRSDAAASAKPETTAPPPSGVAGQASIQRSVLIRVDVDPSSTDGRTLEATVRRVLSARADRKK